MGICTRLGLLAIASADCFPGLGPRILAPPPRGSWPLNVRLRWVDVPYWEGGEGRMAVREGLCARSRLSARSCMSVCTLIT